jgi:apolipoprotein N-acyltransferase
MIRPTSRFFAALATWGLVWLSSPGILGRDGFGPLALVALVPWAFACSRSGPRALLAEWLAAGIGTCLLCSWSAYVWPGTLLFLAIVPGFYMAAAGSVLRLVARRYPLAVAAPVAWVALETLRCLVEPPFGFGWLRLGTCLHAVGLISGSARWWGTGGLSFLAAACAGGVADLLRRRVRHDRREARRRSPRWAPILGGVPLAIGIAVSASTAAPATRPGPRVLLVQPSFEQHRKMRAPDWRELAEESFGLTAKGVADCGAAPPDLVAWGETMFPFQLAEPGLEEAFERGARPPSWARDQLSSAWIQSMDAVEASWIRGRLFGERGILPAGTSFLTGVEYHALAGGAIRRQNAILLWNAAGARAGVAGKIHLVPGAENMCGAERIGFVRSAVESVAGYVPDLLAFERTKVLDLRTRDGRTYRFGASVCFDNTYDDPYTAPLREGDLDFHLVCSNEAWYEKSFEYDQMVAFSRLLALATGRSIVRATNAGVSIVLDPAGKEVARLTSPGGDDRMVAGALAAVVPVPAEGAEHLRTPFVRFEKAWLGLWLLLPFLLGFFVIRGGYTSFERG